MLASPSLFVDKLSSLQDKFCYLAAPYRDPSLSVQEFRIQKTTEVTTYLLNNNIYVFSPLTYSNSFINTVTFQEWGEFDLHILKQTCDTLLILCLDGWKQSEGVQQEIDAAIAHKLDIKYLVPIYYPEKTLTFRFGKYPEHDQKIHKIDLWASSTKQALGYRYLLFEQVPRNTPQQINKT